MHFTNNWLKNRRLILRSRTFFKKKKTPFYTLVIFFMAWKFWDCSLEKWHQALAGLSYFRMIPGTHMVGRDTTKSCPLTSKFMNLSHFHNFSIRVYFFHLKNVIKIKFVFCVLKWTNRKKDYRVKFQAEFFILKHILTVLTCSGRGALVNPSQLALKESHRIYII